MVSFDQISNTRVPFANEECCSIYNHNWHLLVDLMGGSQALPASITDMNDLSDIPILLFIIAVDETLTKLAFYRPKDLLCTMCGLCHLASRVELFAINMIYIHSLHMLSISSINK